MKSSTELRLRWLYGNVSKPKKQPTYKSGYTNRFKLTSQYSHSATPEPSNIRDVPRSTLSTKELASRLRKKDRLKKLRALAAKRKKQAIENIFDTPQ